jgi:toxin ParE1/3/4
VGGGEGGSFGPDEAMTYSLVLQRAAQREFDEAADWYDRQRTGLGVEFIEEVNRVLDQLRAGPERYPVVHEDIREGPVDRFPYVVYYRIEPGRVVVVAVIHTSRDPAAWQGRA